MVFELLGPIFSSTRLGKNQPNVFLFPPEVFQHFCRDVRGFLNVTNAHTQIFLPVLKSFQMGEGLGVSCRGPAWPLYFYPLCQNSPSLWVGLQPRGWLIPFFHIVISVVWTEARADCIRPAVHSSMCRWIYLRHFQDCEVEVMKATLGTQKYLRDSAETQTEKNRNILNSLLQLVRCSVMLLYRAGITCLLRDPALESEV